MSSQTKIIACIPLWARSTPPPPDEQEDPQPLPCPTCEALMWVSKRKREIIAMKREDTFVICIKCIAEIQKEFKIPAKHMEAVELATVNFDE